jgi:para-nitrobenzyl esterase
MPDDYPFAQLASGGVRGEVTNGVRQFRGIPYAASAAGDNRFRPPQPLDPWSGIRDASSWGAMAPQPAHTSLSLEATNPQLFADAFGPSYDQAMSEDCLTMHVWAPDSHAQSPRPIMVWLHGGGFDHGTSATPRTDGSALAAKHDVVVVAVTHRLGAIGYTYLDDIDPSYRGSANVGMLDIVAALEWIATNAVAFGGDPTNVTLFGESGGGCKISTLMAMPAARGLFHKAIIQSGPFAEPPTPVEATATARMLLAELDIDTDRPLRPQLDNVGFADIAAAQEILISSGRLGGLAFSPVRDGVTVVESQFDAITEGGGSSIPLLIGFNENEWGSFGSTDSAVIKLDQEGLTERTRSVAGAIADDLIAMYRSRMPSATSGDLWVRMMGDRILMLSTWDVVERRVRGVGATTFTYLFTWVSPAYPQVGSFHGIEGGFVFDTTQSLPIAASDPDAATIAGTTSATWAAFARDGNPSHSGIPAVPTGRANHETLVLGGIPHLASDPFGAIRALWRIAEQTRANGGDNESP